MRMRVLSTKEGIITNNYQNHLNGGGWAMGTDVVDVSKGYASVCDITAHSAGKVIKVVDYIHGHELDANGWGFGNYVAILHKKNIVTLYAHMVKGSIRVVEGQMATNGQIIGRMGNTGNAYGAHLHFEMRLYNAPPDGLAELHDKAKFIYINPEPYLNAAFPDCNKDENILYRVQQGAFEILENAKNLRKELISKNIDAIIKRAVIDDKVMYRVQTGAFSVRENAMKQLETVIAAGYKNAFITTEAGEDYYVD